MDRCSLILSVSRLMRKGPQLKRVQLVSIFFLCFRQVTGRRRRQTDEPFRFH